jgi:hypothetical protein
VRFGAHRRRANGRRRAPRRACVHVRGWSEGLRRGRGVRVCPRREPSSCGAHRRRSNRGHPSVRGAEARLVPCKGWRRRAKGKPITRRPDGGRSRRVARARARRCRRRSCPTSSTCLGATSRRLRRLTGPHRFGVARAEFAPARNTKTTQSDRGSLRFPGFEPQCPNPPTKNPLKRR